MNFGYLSKDRCSVQKKTIRPAVTGISAGDFQHSTCHHNAVDFDQNKTGKAKLASASCPLFLQQRFYKGSSSSPLSNSVTQTKLTVGTCRDPFEQEADQVASDVMSMPDAEVEAALETDENQEGGAIQAKYKAGQSSLPSADMGTSIPVLSSGGRPLSPSNRAFFEPRFNADFSDVRIHSDSQAANSAETIDARAYTSGRDVVFGPNEYSPETSTGKQLLAHELTHVLQQSRGLPGVSKIQRREKPKSTVIPDLDKDTADNLVYLVKMAKSVKFKQKLLNEVVRAAKIDTSIIANNKFEVVNKYPEIDGREPKGNGLTIHPKSGAINPSSKPRVLIGPDAFGTDRRDAKEIAVRLYSTVRHEYVHVQQWQIPKAAEALGRAGREFEAYLWEIENSESTGLKKHKRSLLNVKAELVHYWKDFQLSSEWKTVEVTKQKDYKDRYGKAINKVKLVLGK